MKGRLLDTHALLWALLEPERLSSTVRGILEDETVPVFTSAVNFWEISLKHALGKLDLPGTTPEELLSESRKALGPSLPLSAEVAASSHHLPRLHNDPFDRMLVRQAIMHDLILITKDASLQAYEPFGLQLEW